MMCVYDVCVMCGMCGLMCGLMLVYQFIKILLTTIQQMMRIRNEALERGKQLKAGTKAPRLSSTLQSLDRMEESAP